MSIDDVREKTINSKKMLELARRYAEEAEKLSEGNEKRNWLEQEALKLLNDARELTQQANKHLS